MVISFNKWILLPVVALFYVMPTTKGQNALPVTKFSREIAHPFHVSVTEINHNAADKTLEVSCKIFTDDFESALSKKFQTKVDLINPKDKAAMDKYVNAYIHEHLQLKADGKGVTMNYLGYEVENEAVFAYLQVDNIAAIKKIDVASTIMYDMFTDQIGINHVMVGGNRKSVKLDYPASQASVQF